jgi:hypothetical protein
MVTTQAEGLQPGKIHHQIALVMADIEAIGKDKRNQQQGYNFRGIDDVYNELHGHLAKHGVYTVPRTLDMRREERPSKSGGVMAVVILTIAYRFYADDGSFVEAVMIGEGMDSGDKASNKAQAVAHKYALIQVFAIPTEDAKDPENDSPQVQQRQAPPKQQQRQAPKEQAPPPAPPPQKAPPVANITTLTESFKAVGVDQPELLRYCGVGRGAARGPLRQAARLVSERGA